MNKSKDNAIITISMPYIAESNNAYKRILEYVENYNWVLRFTYNRLKERDFKASTKEITALQNGMSYIFVDSHFKNSAIYNAKEFRDKEKVIFGGRRNFVMRCRNEISRDEFLSKRLSPLYSVGEANKYGNRKFTIIDGTHILFKPCKDEHFTLTIPKARKNWRKKLDKLRELQNSCAIPITYSIDSKLIHITFDENALYDNPEPYEYIPERVLAADLNPDNIGWVVAEWQDSDTYKIISSGLISYEKLYDKAVSLGKSSDSPEFRYLYNKARYETVDNASTLVNIAKHYRCEYLVLEELNIRPKDFGKRKVNRKNNNLWQRDLLTEQVNKRCTLSGIKRLSVRSAYSSILGNFTYRSERLPDSCLAAIELSRRGYEVIRQYIAKNKPKIRNIVVNTSPEAFRKIVQSWEELCCLPAPNDVYDFLSKLKNLKLRYRFPIKSSAFNSVFSKKSIRSEIILYSS